MRIHRFGVIAFILFVQFSVSHAIGEESGGSQVQGPVFNNTGRNACNGAVVVPVAVGPVGSPVTTTIMGNNSTATGPDCIPPNGTHSGPVWWEAFQITEKAVVTIDLCGTTPLQDPSYDLIYNGCVFPQNSTCINPIFSSSSGRGGPFCGDGNQWSTYMALDPGTYRVPVLSDPSVLVNGLGPYVMHIHASACPGACCNMDTVECEDCVDPALCVDPGEEHQAGESCFQARCFSPDGPDVVVGIVWECKDLGRVGPMGTGTVAMSCNTTACNQGNEKGNWWALPLIDHPVIAVNMYRMNTVAGSSRFEQLGHSWLKHGFGSANANECSFGCVPGAAFEEIGVGCSDTYDGLQFDPCSLGPRSMINPYTGVMPQGPSMGVIPGCGPFVNDNQNYPANDHRDHVHTPISHKVQLQEVDLLAGLNPGARYFAEGQYVAPHEFNIANGNQNNNVSHVEVAVSGPNGSGQYSYNELTATFVESPAVNAWTGASQTMIEPAPLADGRSYLAWQATDLGGGQWHYEYAVYNQNMDRAIGSLCIPLAPGVNVSNVGFHAPLNHAPEPHTDTYSNDPWVPTVTADAIRWDTESVLENPLANAVRFGTLYNFRFDANVGPQAINGGVGLFKNAATVVTAMEGPSPATFADLNNNGLADVCETMAPLSLLPDPTGIDKNRYLSFVVPQASVAGTQSAIQVTLVDLQNPQPPNLPQFPPTDFSAYEGQKHYVGVPENCMENDSPLAFFKCAALQCTPAYVDWNAALNGEILHATSSAVIPSSTYHLRQVPQTCMGNELNCGNTSEPLTVKTQRWGDCVAPFQELTGALNQPNVSDIAAQLDKFKGAAVAPIVARVDLHPGTVNRVSNIADCAGIIDGFKNFAYPFTITVNCP